MPKTQTRFVCQKCGYESIKWLGRCPDCSSWNSLTEEVVAPRAAATPLQRAFGTETVAPQPISEITLRDHPRVSSGIGEFDRVLGGGIVPGSLVLIGGEPGIGKSTLLLQAASHFANTTGPVLYSSGEESEHQIKSRGERLGVARAPLYLLAEPWLERILEEIARLRPALIIIDSVPTVFSWKFQSAPR